MNANLAILLSAFLHASWNALIKKWGKVEVTTIGFILFATLWSYIALFLIKDTLFKTNQALIWGLVAGLAEGGYFATLAIGLGSGNLGPFYSISRGGAMVIVWILSIVLQLTKITLLSSLGGFIILVGIIISTPKNNPFSNRKTNEILSPFLCALFIGIHHICYKFALNNGAHPQALFSLSLTMGMPILWSLQKKDIKNELIHSIKTHYLKYGFGGMICFISFVIFLTGLKSENPNVAISLRNTSILFALVYSKILGEKLNTWQILGGLMVAIGATLVTLQTP